jgi:DNA-directed RNA polymerase beta' subunit
MISIVDIDQFIENNNILPVTNISMYDNNGDYTEDGLFSEKIFGDLNTNSRKVKYGYIDLGLFILNPLILSMLMKTDQKIKEIIRMETSYTLDEEGILIKDKENGRTGISFLKEILENGTLNLRPYNDKREKVNEYVKENMEKMWIDKWLVIPPYYRENIESDDFRTIDDLNNYYTSLIKLSGEKIKNDMTAWSLQKIVLDIYDYIKSKLSKKEGYIRGNLMGKRVDFSGRAVIINNYNLKLHEAGIPYEMLVKLFEPFIIHEMMNDETFKQYNNLELKRILDKVYNKTMDNNNIRSIVKKVIQDKIVLLKRDPALHRGSVQAFKPIIAQQNAIEIHPAVVGPFNADFDGDSISGTKVKLEIKKDNKTIIINKNINELHDLKL